VIAPGADADVVVWDPAATHTISAETSHQNTDYNLYEGMHVTGVPVVVLSRGNVVVDHGEWKGAAGAGKFLRRNRFGQTGQASAEPSAPARARSAAGAKGK
jgi:dihydropyrimidinase